MKALVTFVAWCLVSGSALAAGTVETVQFASAALGEVRSVQVYLPEGYGSGSADYPAIYFLHGANGTHLGYPELISYLNILIGNGQIEPVVVIKPDGSGCPWSASWEGCGWVNSELQGNYEDFLVQDVVAFAESQYRIIPDPGRRAILGHSMGAFGSLHAALKHPDLFVAAAAHSGYPYFDEFITQHVPLIIAEQTGPPPWTYTPGPFFTAAWFMLSGGFSPDLTGPPYHVNFPLDGHGEVIPGVWEDWVEHDPATLALSLAPESAPEIYIDCGTGDGFLLYPFNAGFSAHLSSLGIDHEFQSFAGGHYVPSRFSISLQFLDAALNPIIGVGESQAARDGSIVRLDVPNPWRSDAAVTFEVAGPGPATMAIFDVSGRVIATLLDGTVAPGIHRVSWSAGDMKAGVYFCRLRSGGDQEVRRVVVR